MGIGALFGALNSMYSAVSTRTQEIATLRAIGFAATPVLLSVLIEALLLSLIGGAIGASVAWVLFNGHNTSTLGSTFSQVVFQLQVTPALLVLGVVWACAIGLIGGFFPALRAARAPIVEALRAG
jgi:putative ABC transport system permease protein